MSFETFIDQHYGYYYLDNGWMRLRNTTVLKLFKQTYGAIIQNESLDGQWVDVHEYKILKENYRGQVVMETKVMSGSTYTCE